MAPPTSRLLILAIWEELVGLLGTSRSKRTKWVPAGSQKSPVLKLLADVLSSVKPNLKSAITMFMCGTAPEPPVALLASMVKLTSEPPSSTSM